jgi:hypothetical protein
LFLPNQSIFQRRVEIIGRRVTEHQQHQTMNAIGQHHQTSMKGLCLRHVGPEKANFHARRLCESSAKEERQGQAAKAAAKAGGL